MKITRELRKEINAAVRERCGFAPLAEVGLRGVDDAWGSNALMWGEDDDLDGFVTVADLKEINDDPNNPGCAELDLYVTSGRGLDRELETNVAILIRDGHVVGATRHSREIASLKNGLAFPVGKGW